jgi:hypothetical protein
MVGSVVAGYTGVVQFHRLDGSRNGVIGFNAENGPMHYGSDTGAGHYFEGGIISPDPNMHFGLRFNGVDGIIDFDTDDYAYFSRSTNSFSWVIGNTQRASLDSSGTFVAASIVPGDANYFLTMTGANPTIHFDSGDAISYDRAANKFTFAIGGVNVASIDAFGNLRIKGTLSQGVTP